MSETRVVNLRWDLSSGYKRIDRATKYGNPFPMKDDSDEERRRVIQEFREWWYGDEQEELREKAKEELKGEKLACWCAPKPCHGDVIKEYLEHE